VTFWRVLAARLAAVFSIHMRATSSNVCVAAKISSCVFSCLAWEGSRPSAIKRLASAQRARLGEGDGGTDAQCKRLAFSEVAVVEAPVLPGRRHEQVHAVTVRVLLASQLGGFYSAYEGVGERHGSSPIPVTVFSFIQLRYTVKFYGRRLG
jgi:hypothetical protein